MDNEFSELIGVFLQEATEQLEKLDDGLLQLEKEPENTDIIVGIFRAAHTLKGSSATMGYTSIRDLTHDAESLLDALRTADRETRINAVDALLATTSVLQKLVEDIQSDNNSDDQYSEEVARVRQMLIAAMPGNDTNVTGKLTTPQIGAQLVVKFSSNCQMPGVRAFMAYREIADQCNILWMQPAEEDLENLRANDSFTIGIEAPDDFQPQSICEKVSSIPEIASCDFVVVNEDQISLPEKNVKQVNAATETIQKKSSESGGEAHQTVRVAVDQLDKLVNLIGELVVDRTGLAIIENSLTASYGNDDSVQQLGGIASHLGRVVGDLHDEIMKMRMLPVGQVFRRFPRMVRDLSQKLGKKIDLVLEGEETGLDRLILEDIVDPLTHLLRNSIDHGIETPAERKAAGKKETGLVVLSARHEEGHVVIEIEDDGHGIDSEKIRQKAVDKGIITKEAAAKMDDRESYSLLFVSGISTAKQVTDVSGRGVGMDVVKNNIEKLHGHVEVNSQMGQGTKFTIRLPLTLAIVQSLLVRSGGRIFAIPLNSVVSATMEPAGKVFHISGIPCVVIRNQTLPLLSATTIFESDEHTFNNEKDLLVVIVQSRGQLAAFAVDELIGKMDIVVKSLGSYLGDIAGLSGAAILGDGNLALIADIGSILEQVRKKRSGKAA